MFVGIVPVGVSAEGQSAQSNIDKTGKSVMTVISQRSKMKRTPSRVNIEVMYADGMVSMTSEYVETVLNLTFTNLYTGESETIPSISIGEYVPMDLETGSYELSAEEPDGGSFSGAMEIYDL